MRIHLDQLFKSLAAVVICALMAGCHDGPLYALKTINPFYLNEWSEDEELGPTDHQRRRELERLVETMPTLSASDQAYWLTHVESILEKDKNAGMRTLAIRALAGHSRSEDVYRVCEQEMNDESIKVRLAICDVLAARDEARSTELLATFIGSETNEAVKIAAIRAIGSHHAAGVKTALRSGLDSRNPAVRVACVESLESSTGASLGDDPAVWVAYLEGRDVSAQEKPLSEKVKDLF